MAKTRAVGPSGEIPGYKPIRPVPSKALKRLVENVKQAVSQEVRLARFSPTKLKIGTDIPYDPDEETTVALKRMFAEEI